MIRIILAVIVVSMISCQRHDKIEHGKENWVEGTVQSNDRIDTVFFHDCYCNLINEHIVLNHVYFGGMHGGHLTTRKYNDSIELDLSYYPYDFRTFSFEQKKVELQTSSPQLGDTITGTIVVVGQSLTREKESYKFHLRGRFK